MSEYVHIAIDGPAASGKGTIAANLSERLGIPCLDTGAIYRGIAVYVREKGSNDISKIKIDAKIIDNVTHIFLDGRDVTDKLRENEISQIASKIATLQPVRELCTKISQEIASRQSLICEGRDISSVVLPNAKYKFFLTAHVKVRAKRRHAELRAKGINIKFAQVLDEIKARDERDATKGGLVQTNDSYLIDSTRKGIDKVTRHILKYIR